jgi:ABC-2 type transport system ATP-binding protein
MNEPYVTVEDLAKRFGNRDAVRPMSFSCRPGVTALVGPNGAGKTTLLRMLTGVVPPSRGRVSWGSRVPTLNGWPVIGYLPQEFGYYAEFSARTFLRLLAGLRGISEPAASRRVDESLERVGLAEQGNHLFRALSGGMRRRVGMAQTLLVNSPILVLDEPAAGLDPEERLRLRLLLTDLGRQSVVIVSTHIMSDVEAVASHLLLLDQGNLITDATPQELIDAAMRNVWEVMTDQANVPVIQAHYTVSNVAMAGSRLAVRIVAADPPDLPGAHAVVPSLEEAYLYAINRGVACKVGGPVSV